MGVDKRSFGINQNILRGVAQADRLWETLFTPL